MKNASGKSNQNDTQRVHVKGTKSKNADQGLRALFVDQLKDLYWAEKELTKAIPKMIKKVTSTELSAELSRHLKETEGHVSRLEELFSSISEKAAAKKCEAMVGIIKEAEQIIDETERGAARDAGIILACQKIEHYEISTYGSLCSFSETLEEDDAKALLQETLNEEKGADEKLSQIAESSINRKAAGLVEERELSYA